MEEFFYNVGVFTTIAVIGLVIVTIIGYILELTKPKDKQEEPLRTYIAIEKDNEYAPQGCVETVSVYINAEIIEQAFLADSFLANTKVDEFIKKYNIKDVVYL